MTPGRVSFFQLYQYALRKGEAITPTDAVYKTRKAKNRGEAIDFFRRLEEMGWGRTITTPRTIKFEAFEERKVSDPLPTAPNVKTPKTDGNSLSEPVLVKVSAVETQEIDLGGDRSQTAVMERDTDSTVPSVNNNSIKVEKLVEELRNCKDRAGFVDICDRDHSLGIQEACQILATSCKEDRKQLQNIKFWTYERKLGGEIKVGNLINLKGDGNSSFNTWEIKSVEVENNCLWVERIGYKVKAETRRVKFSDVDRILTKS